MSTNKHENYELLNLIGYGLAKFNMGFVECFGFYTKTDLYKKFVQDGVAETTSVVKNRQDIFDPFFDNGRKGWWKRGDVYKHRKVLIDTLYGDLDVEMFANIVKLHIDDSLENTDSDSQMARNVSPLLRSKFNQLQITGQKAELFFMTNYQMINEFTDGTLEDARLFGDGYDFQIQKGGKFYLAEVKGVRGSCGGIRMTKNEYAKATTYRTNYSLVIVKNLDDIPEFTPIFDPINTLQFTQKTTTSTQLTYHSATLKW